MHDDLRTDFFVAERWWGKAVDGQRMEIDIVGESTDGQKILVGECKWSELAAPDTLQGQLIAKAKRLPFYKGQEIVPVLVAKTFGHTPKCTFLNAEDLMHLLHD